MSRVSKSREKGPGPSEVAIPAYVVSAKGSLLVGIAGLQQEVEL